MIKVKVNNHLLTSIVGYPVIEQTKSKKNNVLNTDITRFSLRDEKGSLMPMSLNSIIDYDSPEENNIEILIDNALIYKGILDHTEIINEQVLELWCKTEINKYLRDNVKYKTWDRFGGTFPVGEYKLFPNGLYYETPVYLIKHFLESLGNTNFNQNSIDIAHNIYDINDCYVQVNTDYISLRPKEIINFICLKTHLFIYTDSNGNINFIHGIDYKNNPLLINETVKNDIQSLDELYMFNNYSIEDETNIVRTAADNNNYGSQYRSIFDIAFEIEKGIIWVQSDSRDYLGTFAIDKFFRRRQGINFKFELGPETFNLERGISITSSRRGWSKKLFEPYGLKESSNTNKFEVDAYEVL